TPKPRAQAVEHKRAGYRTDGCPQAAGRWSKCAVGCGESRQGEEQFGRDGRKNVFNEHGYSEPDGAQGCDDGDEEVAAPAVRDVFSHRSMIGIVSWIFVKALC